MNILKNNFKLACAIGAGITGIVSGIYWYHGAFSDIEFRDSKYGPYDFVYYKRVGSYQTLGSEWSKMSNEVQKQFSTVHFIGIYYDNPEQLKDPNQARAALGFAVGNCEKDKIKAFLDSHPNYKFTELPEVQSHSTSFPFKSYFSFKIVKDKIYPKVRDFVFEKKLKSYCLIESYLFQVQNKKINFDIPIGNNSQSYLLF
ncbi:glutathione S-transferase, amine-terminal domain protein (macronuclear) [Tetrahymena thermophila SB210]|uniref:Glutathione S-transferase, amine-terminal domain protein n=1 Tax=Tetrahymena thermophila (strain SB210) TaxID=312017 RepID=W7XB34_TETTS|nr:glutathione S-transferase, amine-terminal domain protein [Tetrahymena thermophila SB210]EWS74552.1 glutathione S-transferase, amine-terminal domain protein [Tetrahymena thermophila SB210]|eukprot:XP_012652926.1 glutathione S-transferase, amine-terminal domain protein [Tetrahymena thermophila SB210]